MDSIPIKNTMSDWLDYEDLYEIYSLEPSDEWPAKMHNVYNIMRELRPKTVLDIGSNSGWFSMLAARLGAEIVAMDIDEPSLTDLYASAKRDGIPILPLLVDVCSPAPSHGDSQAYEPATERLRCEMVLALAITHHLVFKKRLGFASIARKLSEFTQKWLVVEFVPPEDKYAAPWVDSSYSWYSLDNFVRSLRPHFERVDVMDSSPAPRKILLCWR